MAGRGILMLVLAGLALVYSAKTHNFAELSARLERGELLDLNQVSEARAVAAVSADFPNDAEREMVAAQDVRLSRHAPPHPERRRAGALRAAKQKSRIIPTGAFSTDNFRTNSRVSSASRAGASCAFRCCRSRS